MNPIYDYQFAVYVLLFGAVFAWLFRRIGLVDVIGYVVGGIALGAVVHCLGIDVPDGAPYIEIVSWIGIVLFSFRVGTSIGLKNLLLHYPRLIALELVVLIVQWISSVFVAFFLGLDTVARMALFLLFVNSSTIALLALERLNVGMSLETKSVVYVQTQLEDLVQFILFSMIIVGGAGGLNPINILLQVVKVAGVTLILVYLSRYVLRLLSRSPLMAGRENKFFTSIAVVLVFTSVATFMGLPPLFGAFVAGVVFSLSVDIGDIADRLDGLKDLGLLLYFSSLGFQLCLGLRGAPNAQTLIVSGIAVGILSFISRSIGLFLGSVLSGYGLELCLSLSLFLTPLSESGVMFVDALTKQGVVSSSTAYMLMVALLSSLTAFSVVVPRIALRMPAVIKILPKRIVYTVNSISQEYTKRISALTSVLSKVVVFASVVLAISYIDMIVKILVERLSLPLAVSAISTIASTTVILILFVVAIRRILLSLVLGLGVHSRHGIIEKLFDAIVGGLAIALQAQILHEFISRYPMVEPLSIAVVVSVLAIIAITVRDTLAYLKGVR